jgi:hypothetical protein
MKKTIVYSFIFLAIISSSLSCIKGPNTKFPFYFTATVNNQNVKYEANDLSSRYECGISSPSSSIGTSYDMYEGTVLEDMFEPYKNRIEVLILKYFNHYPDYQTEVIPVIQAGNYGYGIGNVSNGINTVNGAVIRYVDGNGDEWSSEEGVQTGSTFKITEVANNTTGTSGKIFTAQFSCKVYNTSGASIEIKNATIRGKAFLP